MGAHVTKILFFLCDSNRKENLSLNKAIKTRISTLMLTNIKIQLAPITKLHQVHQFTVLEIFKQGKIIFRKNLATMFIFLFFIFFHVGFGVKSPHG